MTDRSTCKLAANVEDARRARGLTQKALADAANTTREVIANLASGRMQSASLELAMNLASALDMPLGTLVGECAKVEVAAVAQRNLDAIRLILDA